MMAITPNRLNTIQRTSKNLRAFIIFLIVMAALGMVTKWTHPTPHDVKTIAGVAFEGPALTDKIETLWRIQTILTGVLNLKILYHIVTLLGLYSKGKLFTAANVSQIRQIGLTMLCALPIWLIGLIGAAPEIMAAQDQWLRIMPSFPGGAALSAAIMVYVSWIVNEGRELRDEQDLVV